MPPLPHKQVSPLQLPPSANPLLPQTSHQPLPFLITQPQTQLNGNQRKVFTLSPSSLQMHSSCSLYTRCREMFKLSSTDCDSDQGHRKTAATARQTLRTRATGHSKPPWLPCPSPCSSRVAGAKGIARERDPRNTGGAGPGPKGSVTSSETPES